MPRNCLLYYEQNCKSHCLSTAWLHEAIKFSWDMPMIFRDIQEGEGEIKYWHVIAQCDKWPQCFTIIFFHMCAALWFLLRQLDIFWTIRLHSCGNWTCSVFHALQVSLSTFLSWAEISPRWSRQLLCRARWSRGAGDCLPLFNLSAFVLFSLEVWIHGAVMSKWRCPELLAFPIVTFFYPIFIITPWHIPAFPWGSTTYS